MKATIENLKANKEQIMSRIIATFGEKKLRFCMMMLKEWASEDSTIDELIDELNDVEVLQESRRKTSTLAEMQGAWMERNGYSKFNNLTKKFA